MNEFEMIAKYFAPLSLDGLRDDGVVLDVPRGHELVVSTDMLNEGVHFWQNEEPRYIAQKALRVNLSDLASMGAHPLYYQLALGLPKGTDEAWIARFSAALAEEQRLFSIQLSGGDTTGTHGPLSLSITVMGVVPKGKAVRRGGAKVGDVLAITGCVGDAYIGLQILRGDLESEHEAHFLERYRVPHPRCNLSDLLHAHVHAAADISDGLLADAGHIALASDLKAVIEMERVAFSPQADGLLVGGQVSVLELLAGGDDYELVMAVSADEFSIFQQAAAERGVQVQAVGRFEAGTGLEVLDGRGQKLEIENTGWRHF